MKQELYELMLRHEPDYNKLPGGVKMNCNYLEQDSFLNQKIYKIGKGIHYINEFLTIDLCDSIIESFEKYKEKFAPVTMQGLQDVTNDNIGSHRITGFNIDLADIIYDSFKGMVLPTELSFMSVNPYTPTDWFDDEKTFIKNNWVNDWEFVGISPMMRYMRYQKGGKHNPHYDAAFKYPNSNYRTLKSFVLYLTTNNSGETRFIKDNQDHLPTYKRNFSDWDREAELHEVKYAVKPIKGDILIFDHRLCHDVSEFIDENSDRIIIRGDLVYENTLLY